MTFLSIFSVVACQSNFCKRLDEIARLFTEEERQDSDEYLAALSDLHGWQKGTKVSPSYVMHICSCIRIKLNLGYLGYLCKRIFVVFDYFQRTMMGLNTVSNIKSSKQHTALRPMAMSSKYQNIVYFCACL